MSSVAFQPFCLTLPWPPARLSPNARAHWTARFKAKRSYATECWAALIEQRVPKLELDSERVLLEITFNPPNARKFDCDNALARLKAGIDVLAHRLRVNDSRFDYAIRIRDPLPPTGRVTIHVRPQSTEA